MRQFAFAIAFACLAAPAAAAPPAAPSAAEEFRIPPELTDPTMIDKLTKMNEALAKALLDLPIGEVQAAAEGRTATEADRRRTIREASRLSERDLEQQIARARPQVQAAMQAFARSLPAMTRALSEAADSMERAIENMPRPDYPKR